MTKDNPYQSPLIPAEPPSVGKKQRDLPTILTMFVGLALNIGFIACLATNHFVLDGKGLFAVRQAVSSTGIGLQLLAVVLYALAVLRMISQKQK